MGPQPRAPRYLVAAGVIDCRGRDERVSTAKTMTNPVHTQSWARLASDLSGLRSLYAIGRNALAELEAEAAGGGLAQVTVDGPALGLSADELAHLSRTHDQLQAIRLVDHFDLYLSDLLLEISSVRPNILRGAPSVEVSRLLEAESLDTVRAEIAQEWVRGISRRGIDRVIETLGKALGLQLSLPPSVVSSLRYAAEVRNSLVHHRGVVDEYFLRQSRSSEQSGAAIEIDLDAWYVAVLAAAQHIDFAAIRKIPSLRQYVNLGVPRPDDPNWLLQEVLLEEYDSEDSALNDLFGLSDD